MTKYIKTTDKEFEAFKEYCKKYVSLFELNDFEVHFELKKIKGAYATTVVDIMGHSTVISLNLYNPPETNLQKIALHEVCHLLIAKLTWLARSRYVMSEEIEETNEEVTVKLTNALNKRLEI